MPPRDDIFHDLNFSVIAEDDDFIVIDKPSHLLVHPTNPNHASTLWDELNGLLMYELATGGQISIITRLDRETSGIVLVAKSRAAARQAGLAMQNGEFEKTYLAIVLGHPGADKWTCDLALRRKGEFAASPIHVKQASHPDGKASRTDFQVRQCFEREIGGQMQPFALIECQPIHGRMHQIRVHLAESGHPIVGDKIYGADETCYLDFIETGWTLDLERRLLLNRQALHAHRLRWPVADRAWTCALPAVLESFVSAASSKQETTR
jgi:23S rRNA pseudouridine1911/1915/1917 synthase